MAKRERDRVCWRPLFCVLRLQAFEWTGAFVLFTTEKTKINECAAHFHCEHRNQYVCTIHIAITLVADDLFLFCILSYSICAHLRRIWFGIFALCCTHWALKVYRTTKLNWIEPKTPSIRTRWTVMLCACVCICICLAINTVLLLNVHVKCGSSITYHNTHIHTHAITYVSARWAKHTHGERLTVLLWLICVVCFCAKIEKRLV